MQITINNSRILPVKYQRNNNAVNGVYSKRQVNFGISYSYNLNLLLEYLKGDYAKRIELVEGGKDSVLGKIISEFAEVYDRKHPPHQEGNLGQHTILFYKNMVRMLNTNEFGKFNDDEQVLLLISSILHDIDKDCPEIFLKDIQTPLCCQFALNRLTNSGHEKKKAEMLIQKQLDEQVNSLVYKHPLHNVASRDKARHILEKMGMEPNKIEKLCNLIELHMIIGEFSFKTIKGESPEYHQKIKEVARKK